MAALAADPAAVSLVFWRGKPMMGPPDPADDSRKLVRLPLSHAVFAKAGLRLFLGLDDHGPIFGFDILNWVPDGFDVTELSGFLDQTEQRHPDGPAGNGLADLRGNMTRLSARDAELAATGRALLEWHRTHLHCACCGAASDVAQEGWQRRCPDCGALHFPRTDPVVIMLITFGNSVLLGRSPGWPDGMYSLLAGFVEPGETIEAAVRRETLEEAGILVGPVRYLASQPWAFPTNLMIGCHGEAMKDQIRLDPKELEDALWVTREETMQAMAGKHPCIKPARPGSIAHFLLRNWLADTLD